MLRELTAATAVVLGGQFATPSTPASAGTVSCKLTGVSSGAVQSFCNWTSTNTRKHRACASTSKGRTLCSSIWRNGGEYSTLILPNGEYVRLGYFETREF